MASGKWIRFLKKAWRPAGLIIAPLVFVVVLCATALGVLNMSMKDIVNIGNVFLIDTKINANNPVNDFLDPDLLAPEDQIPEGGIFIGDIDFPTYESVYGEMTIESIGLQCPLVYGDSEAAMAKGVGQYIGSRIVGYPGTTLICAHVNRQFANLHNVQVGDLIVVRTTYGTYTYKTVNVGVYSADDPTAFDLSREDENLALYTCYYEMTPLGSVKKRFFVHADYVSGPLLYT